MNRIRSLGAAVLLAALLLGIPAALIGIGGNPIPSALPSWEQALSTFANPVTSSFLLGALMVVAWVAWATFAVAILIELPAALRGRRARPVRGLGLQQRLAASLLGAIILTSGATTAMASPLDTYENNATAAAVTAVEDEAETSSDTSENAQSGEDEAAAPATAVETTWDVHTVEPGQSLWEIAEKRLGDGARWQELADLNYDLPQPDGHHLTTEHWLNTGWELRIPGTDRVAEQTTTETTPTTSDPKLITVEAGDTLSAIALEHLGDANRYPEILEVSAAIEQPGGYRMTDPDQIDIGWQVALPASATAAATDEAPPTPTQDQAQVESQEAATAPPAPASPVTAPEPQTLTQEPVAASPDPTEAATAEPTTSTTDQGHEATQVPLTEEDEGADGIPVRTVGGVGALLAAGILGLLAVRRQRSQRTRPPGQRVARPLQATPDSQIEAELRAVADPIGAETVNIALRDLAAWCTNQGHSLPDVRAARLTKDASELQLFLSEAATLPAPWSGSQDRTVWVLSADDVDEDLLTRTDPLDVPAPWPSLVTVGLDEEDASFLLDLEHVGHLDIRGDAEAAHGTLAALAVELATTPWADDLQVTLVGTMPDLPDVLDTSRVRYVSGLPAVMRELHARAERLQGSPSTRLDLPEAWTPEILIIGNDLDLQTRQQLDSLVARLPRVGIAAVTRDASGSDWALALDPRDTTEGILSPTEMRIRPTQITPADYAALLSVLTGAEHHVPGPTWTQSLAQTHEPILEELPAPVDEPETQEAPTEQADQAETAVVDVRVDQLDLTVPETAPVRALHVPYVRLLGDVTIDGIDASTISATHLTQATEIIAYLALHPGASTEALSRDLWPGLEVKASTRKSAISRARKILGVNEEGSPYLMLGETNPLGSEYRLDPTLTNDWDTFNNLRGPDPTQTPLQDLRQALSLVRGAPFSRTREGRTRVRANRYTWADTITQEMTSSIIDVACETARRALLEGRPKLAADAATTGLQVNRDDERIWRYAIRAAAQMGEATLVDQLIRDLTNHLTDLEVDPQPETNDLLDELAHHTTRHAG